MNEDHTGSPGRSVRSDLLQPGSTIDDRYEVLDVLGEGGCAVVYRVYDRRLKQELALKRLRHDRSCADQSMRLRREVRYAREVHCEHLVKIYDVSGDEQHPYITMELIEGESLAERLHREGALPVSEVRRIGSEVLLALHALHEHGIVHRDVKPGNVLLTPDGKVRLADLGLARALAGGESALTNPESVVGTWEYISPEQALGVQIVPESDLYSFGIVLYEMLTGTLPFDCDSSVGYLSAHLTQPPRRLRKARPDVPSWLDAIVSRLLEKRPAHRYRSAAEVRRDLSSGRSTPTPRLVLRMAAAAVLILILTAATAGYLWWGSRFSELVETNAGGVEALDRRDRTLWVREGVRRRLTAAYRVQGKRHIAMIENSSREASPAERLRISILDPQTGNTIDVVELPSGAAAFSDMPDQFSPADLRVIDIDHDGNDEIHVTYTHHYWPSFSVAWNPLGSEASVVFTASGHHTLAGTADVSEDGTDELLYIGVNNRMGWNWALAAISPASGGKLFSREIQGASPDDYRTTWSRDGLAWYAFLPKDVRSTPTPEIDDERKRILVHRKQKPPLEMLYSGFAASWDSDLPSFERNQHRRRAYERIRQGIRFVLDQKPERANASLNQAVELALTAGDPILATWGKTLQIRALIRSGRFDEAETLIDSLVADDLASPSDTHWEAATTYHLVGELQRALDHYRTGMVLRATEDGRFTREFAIGGVMALVEMKRYDEANDLIDAFAQSDHYSRSDAERLRRYVRWTSGTTPRPAEPITAFILYEFQYWELEYRRDTSGPRELLEETRALLGSTAGLAPMLLSLEADLLHELGRLDEAAAASTRAIRAMQSEIDHNIFVRPHRELIESRHETITQQPAGRGLPLPD